MNECRTDLQKVMGFRWVCPQLRSIAILLIPSPVCVIDLDEK